MKMVCWEDKDVSDLRYNDSEIIDSCKWDIRAIDIIDDDDTEWFYVKKGWIGHDEC